MSSPPRPPRGPLILRNSSGSGRGQRVAARCGVCKTPMLVQNGGQLLPKGQVVYFTLTYTADVASIVVHVLCPKCKQQAAYTDLTVFFQPASSGVVDSPQTKTS